MADEIHVIQNGVTQVTVNVSVVGVPQGGEAGQVLGKSAATDFAVAWVDGAASGTKQFSTVTDMTAELTSSWGVAVCANTFSYNDNILSLWMRVVGSARTPNGDDLRLAGDGTSLLWRVAVYEAL